MRKRLVLVGVALLLAASAATWWWIRSSLPVLDGDLALPGLRGPVEAVIDARGVPHLYAREPEDAWFAVGAFHARDRLWQLELYRRAADGRLSEMFGERTLPIDKRLRTLGLRAAAQAEWARVGPAARMALARYAEGVNAVAASRTGHRRPIELQLLGVSVAPWTPVDSLAVGRLLAWRLAENHQAEIVRASLAARFGAAEAARLAGSYPEDAPSILGPASPLRQTGPASPEGPAAGGGPPSAVGFRKSGSPHVLPFPTREASLTGEAGPTRAAGPLPGLAWLEAGAKRGNSNSWVISGRRTATGRPILANDPHLQIEMPSLWYEVHVIAADLDAIGVTVPGAPFIVIGHNASVAWGLTNTGADVQDLFVERVDIGRRRYLAGGEWASVSVSASDIPIRGRAEPERFEVWTTRHGPLFAEVGLDWEDPPGWLSPSVERAGERRAYALRWGALGGDMAMALEALNRASTWADFVSAVERFESPSQNFVYADVEGNIGYAMSGLLPVRTGRDGSWPVEGWSREEQEAYRSDAAFLPRVINPDSGVISSSNNEVDRSWPGLITRDWAAPFRARRIQQELSGAEPVDLDRAAALQLDVRSEASEAVLPGIPSALAEGRRRHAEPAIVDWLERLHGWDRLVDARPVVAFYQAFEHALWRRVFFDEMGEALFNDFYEWAGAERIAGLFTVLDEPRAHWFDDIGTLDRRETRDDMYLLAASDAYERLTAQFGAEDQWNWSRMHIAWFDHPVGSAAAPLRRFFSRGPIGMIGDGTTVSRVSYHRLRPFEAYEHPSWRQLLDVGNWDDSRVILPAGQSGHPLSPYYFNQNQRWREGRYELQPFSRAAVERAQAHRLMLVP